MQPLREFAIRYINPITRRFAGWLPGFAILTYRGRTSGRTYSIPINVRHLRLVDPELIVDPSAKLVRIPVRWFLRRLARVTEFVRMRSSDQVQPESDAGRLGLPL